MRNVLFRGLPLLLLVLLVASCSVPRKRYIVPEERTTVRVENRSWSEMVVYVTRSGTQRIRLGSVPGVTTRVLTIPESLMGASTPLRFIADPIGSDRAPTSDEIYVNPGDQVTLMIPPR